MTKATFTHRKAAVKKVIQNRSKLLPGFLFLAIRCLFSIFIEFASNNVFTWNNPMKLQQGFCKCSGFIIMIPPYGKNMTRRMNPNRNSANVFRISMDRPGKDDSGSRLEAIAVWYRRSDNRLVMENPRRSLDSTGIRNTRDGIKISTHSGITNKTTWY